ncbi:putative disease resistance RPP13-like protein 3 [Pistacia vera]|uniref:putative disease resistance RPP13-like protein 3 n=1 Tax=Pistacia vera TaxID=55513 RepID=UPI001263CE8E|nr:putative disease resistance RPP13-like protein 3 [Pistacia vera]
MIRPWVSGIIDLAYDAEDVLDAFSLKVQHGGISNTVDVDEGHKEIEKLRMRISDLSRKREACKLQDTRSMSEGNSKALGKLKDLRRQNSITVEENVVGFHADADQLLPKLLGGEPGRIVISIFGMGGLGKTTLAKKFYHNYDINKHFDHCAWVSISQDFDNRNVLQRIMESFKMIETRKEMQEVRKMSRENLERKLHKFLQEKRYLLVLDDVWQKETWESLKRAFPDNKNGSRVIITTRNKEVAQRSDEKTYAHALQFLSPEESWQLFSKKAFQNVNIVDDGLKNLGEQMLQKCGGLPLAIVVLGGLLSTKKPSEWRAVYDSIWRHLIDDSIHIEDLLALSFNDLPHKLKLCFLYIGLFPEDFEINVEKLIRLLLAEGFIQEGGDQIMEDVAADYVIKLINRSLVQIDKRCWGTVVTCRVHDLLRDLAIRKAEELNFYHIYDEISHSSTRSSIASSCRRQAVYLVRERFLWLRHSNKLSRSLLFFNRQTSQLTPLCKTFKFLRVLEVDLFGKTLPKEVGKLIHLIYLGLQDEAIITLPSSIGNLRRLQTLHMEGAHTYVPLPTEISKLQELRHLIGFFSGSLPIANLKKLLTLKYVYQSSWEELNPESLVDLQELQIQCDGDLTIPEFKFETVAKLRSLRVLSVWLDPDLSFPSLQLLGHCRCLVDLRLCGRIEKLPENLEEIFPNLEGLKLADSLLEEDSIPSLERLPNLMFLVLANASYLGKKLSCRANGFPRLEVLLLSNLIQLEEWEVDEDAMPMLRGLSITGCSNKLRIPEKLKSIPLPGKWECSDNLRGNFSLKLL